jgi:hypothetical protein
VKNFATKLFNKPFCVQCVREKIFPKATPLIPLGELDGGISSDDIFIVVQTKLNAKVTVSTVWPLTIPFANFYR